jgi:cyclic pyranopterin phosphate synthase
VLEGIQAAQAAGFRGTKVNMVVVRDFNDDEIFDLLEFGRAHSVEVRFIEYMDVGGATQWEPERVVSRSEVLERISEYDDSVEPVQRPDSTSAPAEQFRLSDGTIFGIIASTTAPFCSTCDRSRLTADGMWLLCLYADSGVDLKAMLRGGATREEIADTIVSVWQGRSDRGAEHRLQELHRGPLYQRERLRQDPHREMHTRGG